MIVNWFVQLIQVKVCARLEECLSKCHWCILIWDRHRYPVTRSSREKHTTNLLDLWFIWNLKPYPAISSPLPTVPGPRKHTHFIPEPLHFHLRTICFQSQQLDPSMSILSRVMSKKITFVFHFWATSKIKSVALSHPVDKDKSCNMVTGGQDKDQAPEARWLTHEIIIDLCI